RTFAATSTVEILDWSGTAELPSPTSWGNLIINVSSYSSNWNQSGDLTDIPGNLDIKNTGTGTSEFRLATAQDYTLNIGGDLIIEGGIFEAAQSNGNHDQVIIINGSYKQTGGTFTRSNNNSNTLQVQFNGANSTFTQSGGTLTDTYMDWIVNASKKLTLNSNLPVSLLRSLTVNGIFSAGGYKVTGLGSFTLASTGEIISSSTSGLDGFLALTGSLLFNTGGSFEFDAATTAPFSILSGSISATNVIINANVTLNKDVTVAGTLTLSSGKLTIPAGNTVTISSGNTVAGSGFGTSKQIVTQVNTLTGAKGMVRMKNFTGTVTLPIGNGTYYLPVSLTAAGTNDFSVAVFQGATTNGLPNGVVMTTAQKVKMVDAVWIANRNSGSNDVTMKLTWPSALEGSTFQGIGDNQIGIAHNGGYWESPLGSGNQSQNTATRSNITNFSPFGVGQIGTPLPLKFGDIKVSEKSAGNVDVNWVSYSEVNLKYFQIERSSNGQQFSAIGKTNARNNNNKDNYTWTDTAPLKTVGYYRVDGVDIDGKANYSTIVKIDPSQTRSDLTLFPNPVLDNRLSVQSGNMDKGGYRILISNIYGRTLYNQTIDHPGGILSQVIQLPSDMPPGVYSISISGNTVKLQKQFVVK
ncbi:MAG TPA: T9SS type A sorting domain-containing protein, partial [Chitinophagaceae bacterium]